MNTRKTILPGQPQKWGGNSTATNVERLEQTDKDYGMNTEGFKVTFVFGNKEYLFQSNESQRLVLIHFVCKLCPQVLPNPSSIGLIFFFLLSV